MNAFYASGFREGDTRAPIFSLLLFALLSLLPQLSQAQTTSIKVEDPVFKTGPSGPGVTVSPNPASSSIVATPAGGTNLTALTIIDSGGITVFEEPLSGPATFLVNFASGTYYFHFGTTEGTVTKTVLIQHP